MITIPLLADDALMSSTEDKQTEIVSESERRAAKRYFFALMQMGDPGLSAATKEQLWSLAPSPCSGIQEATAHSFLYRELLPQELNSHLQMISKWISKTEGFCRDSYTRRAWKERKALPIYQAAPLVTDGTFYSWIIKNIPPLRRFVGYFLASGGQGFYFKLYKEKQ